MKRISFILATALLLVGGCQEYDDTALRGDVDDLKSRMIALELWAVTVNTNVEALQGLVSVLQSKDYVTGVSSFTSPAPGGHIVTFDKSPSVTIYNGQDGLDGQDGATGQTGATGISPRIGVRQDTDGVYYWTLHDGWILDDGHKLRVTGEKGADGQPGQGGQDGQPGANGITPQLRVNVDTNEWEISYGGAWTPTGVKATGDKGRKGREGRPRRKG